MLPHLQLLQTYHLKDAPPGLILHKYVRVILPNFAIVVRCSMTSFRTMHKLRYFNANMSHTHQQRDVPFGG